MRTARPDDSVADVAFVGYVERIVCTLRDGAGLIETFGFRDGFGKTIDEARRDQLPARGLFHCTKNPDFSNFAGKRALVASGPQRAFVSQNDKPLPLEPNIFGH